MDVRAATCSSYPFTLTNGQTADANQVMANFNCAALTSGPTINAPIFTGTTTAPTAGVGDNTTKIATTAYVQGVGGLYGYINGFMLSAAGSTATFGISKGAARDSSNTALMQLTSAYTKNTASWVVGSGQGCIDTGTVAINTWYAVFLIERVDTGVVDLVCTAESAGTPPVPTLPTNYTLSRYVGSMKTDGSGNWKAFVQNGNQFLWANTPVTDINVNPASSQAAETMNVPLGVLVTARIRGWFQGPDSTSTAFLVSSPSEVGTTTVSTGVPSTVNVIAGSGVAEAQGFSVDVLTNLSGQVNIVASSSSASNLVRMSAYGWYDPRGSN